MTVMFIMNLGSVNVRCMRCVLRVLPPAGVTGVVPRAGGHGGALGTGRVGSGSPSRRSGSDQGGACLGDTVPPPLGSPSRRVRGRESSGSRSLVAYSSDSCVMM